MNDFDQIAELWRSQPPAAACAQAVDQTQRRCRRAVAGRQRQVNWSVGLLVLILMILQIFSTMKLDGPSNWPVPMAGLHLTLQVGYAALLLHLGRRLMAHGRAWNGSGDNLRDGLRVSLASTEAAMRDLRVAAWLDPWFFILIPLGLIAICRLTDAITTANLLFRAVLLVAGHLLAWVIGWRIYHGVLCGRHARIRSLLSDLESVAA